MNEKETDASEYEVHPSPFDRYSSSDYLEMETGLKSLHQRWLREGKAKIRFDGWVELLPKILTELEDVWNSLDIELRGQLYAFFTLHASSRKDYPYPEAAVQAVSNFMAIELSVPRKRQAEPSIRIYAEAEIADTNSLISGQSGLVEIERTPGEDGL